MSDAELEGAINVLRGVKMGHRQLVYRLQRILQVADLDDPPDFLDALLELDQLLARIRAPTWPTETTVVHDQDEHCDDSLNEHSLSEPLFAPDGPASPDPELEQFTDELNDSEHYRPQCSDISD